MRRYLFALRHALLAMVTAYRAALQFQDTGQELRRRYMENMEYDIEMTAGEELIEREFGGQHDLRA
jgi:hypothetical protein